MKTIYPIILCGGMGSRLWPMSRIDQPKQFQPTNGKGSLTYFQSTVQRHRSPSFQDPVIVTNASQAALVEQQLTEIQAEGLIISEPVGRNTGPAVLAAALALLADDPDAILLVLPSDHIIVGDMNQIITSMQAAANGGKIITFGVTPGYAESGYGYIIDGGSIADFDGLHAVAKFIEKPSVEVAQKLIHHGNAYWASGISMFRADVICAEFRRLDPHTYTAVSQAVSGAEIKGNHFILNEPAFRVARNEPTERAIFENSPLISLAPVHVQWNDVGAWTSVHDVNPKSDDGNVITGDVLALDSTNSLIQGDGRLVVVIGMNDVIVVDTKDALLVTDRKNAQKVKFVVEQLKSEGRREVISHPFRKHVWGGIEALANDVEYQLDMLTLLPGSTMKINGHGLGASFLSVVSGEATYLEDSKGNDTTLALGSMLTIDKHTEISLTNTAAYDMQAFLLSTTPDNPKRTDASAKAMALMRIAANV